VPATWRKKRDDIMKKKTIEVCDLQILNQLV